MAVRRDGAKSTYDRGLGRRIGDAAPRRTQEPGLNRSERTGLLHDFLRGITNGSSIGVQMNSLAGFQRDSDWRRCIMMEPGLKS